jgi:hypothetical protein
VEKARALSANAPPIENDYIEAIAKRFSSDAKPDYHRLDVNYSKAMGELTRKYPDDLDAATLFADSLMNLRPWKLWNADGTPAEGTNEIVATLEGVLRRDPNHIGAMHLYIHAVEASPHPERALPYADRIAALAPAAGHLVHMPAHIYERTGNFDGARAERGGSESRRGVRRSIGLAGAVHDDVLLPQPAFRRRLGQHAGEVCGGQVAG